MKKLLAIVAVAGVLFAIQPSQDVQAQEGPPWQTELCQFLGQLHPGGILGFNTGRCLSLIGNPGQWDNNDWPVDKCKRLLRWGILEQNELGRCVSYFRTR